MAMEFMSFEEVLAELQIDEDELSDLVAQGELRGFREGDSMKFKKDDVLGLKRGRETEPTIILTDSDAMISLPDEESADLLIDDDVEDQATVLNIDVFEGDDGSSADSDIPTIIESGADLNISGDALDDIEDEDDAAATLIDVGGPTEMATESFDLIEEAPAAEDFEVVDTTIGSGPSRISRSARLRAMQIKKRKGHPIMTTMLFISSAIMLFGFSIFFNALRGVEPNYITDVGKSCRNFIDWITSIF